ncbi:hypothetical protein [Vibrio marisflavi]|uniref:Secretion protein EspA n=1 Tax=Vibrio marisflavi CECT 7928 TaxID=634439 RepID=A0ABM8ZYJ5_9VIBR|nr:hypothetical protein [Vibrio marisflavi]CAH0536013.1 hypothetical protein VMF7928_00109 [Vibrio marisflavi CECT 7928]
MDNVQNSNTMVQQAYASQSDGLTTLDMSSMSIDNILQYVVLTLMQTRDNAANSIQGLMASVQANNKTASDIQNEASAVQGKIPAKDTDTVSKSDIQSIIDDCGNLGVKLNGEDPQTWLNGKSDPLKKSDLVELNGYLNQAASDANQVGQNQQTMLSQNVQNLGNIQKNISAVLSKLIDILKDIIGIIR